MESIVELLADIPSRRLDAGPVRDHPWRELGRAGLGVDALAAERLRKHRRVRLIRPERVRDDCELVKDPADDDHGHKESGDVQPAGDRVMLLAGGELGKRRERLERDKLVAVAAAAVRHSGEDRLVEGVGEVAKVGEVESPRLVEETRAVRVVASGLGAEVRSSVAFTSDESDP